VEAGLVGAVPLVGAADKVGGRRRRGGDQLKRDAAGLAGTAEGCIEQQGQGRFTGSVRAG